MKKEILIADNIDNIYDEINALIREKKTNVKKVVNDAIISLNWGIGKRLSVELTGNNKPEYGKKVVTEVSKRLEQEYGSGFDKTSISRMIKFYQEFPDFEKVATLSQQLPQCVCRKTGQCEHCVKEKNPCFMNELQYRRNQKKRLKMKLQNYEMMEK